MPLQAELEMINVPHVPVVTSEPEETAREAEPPITVIEARPGWRIIDFRELWRFRELLYYLTWRDIKVRYKQTVLGVGWALLQPLAAMLVFAVFIGRLGGIGVGVPNYPLFVFAGILPWTFFANSVITAGNSVVANERLVTRIYFPRLLVPLSCVTAASFDFFIALAMLGTLMAVYGVALSWTILLAPFIFGLLVMTTIGAGTFLAALIVSQRDFRYILGFGVQMWMFATPSIYLPSDSFGPLAQTWLPLNPAHGLILNFRQAMLGGPLDWYALGVSASVAIGLLVIGAAYFRRVERTFADVI